ncbi:uncharacterized protein VNE69_03374 [Vairimorpha necatrix]|uniref:Uncharacterized protein n=1 Tax=Vairimorpha necatrix TaxID=6039 RepID=A0AAX4JB17_9MICR
MKPIVRYLLKLFNSPTVKYINDQFSITNKEIKYPKMTNSDYVDPDYNHKKIFEENSLFLQRILAKNNNALLYDRRSFRKISMFFFKIVYENKIIIPIQNYNTLYKEEYNDKRKIFNIFLLYLRQFIKKNIYLHDMNFIKIYIKSLAEQSYSLVTALYHVGFFNKSKKERNKIKNMILASIDKKFNPKHNFFYDNVFDERKLDMIYKYLNEQMTVRIFEELYTKNTALRLQNSKINLLQRKLSGTKNANYERLNFYIPKNYTLFLDRAVEIQKKIK